MKKTTRSLLEELNEFAQKKHTESVIESRAHHIIDSAVNLIALIKEQFDQETAFELEKRFINSIRSADPNKFTRGIRKVRDLKETAKTLKIVDGNLKDPD
jgi:hypothetical protein